MHHELETEIDDNDGSFLNDDDVFNDGEVSESGIDYYGELSERLGF